MNAEEFYRKSLQLSEQWKVSHIETNDKDMCLYIYLTFIDNKAYDPDSGEEAKIYDWREERIWRDLDTHRYRTYIVARLPRVKCSDGKVKTVNIPWSDRSQRFTHFFEAQVIELLLYTQKQYKAAHLADLSFDEVNHIMKRATDRGLARRELEDGVETISVDEKAFKKGRQFVTVLSDPDQGRVLEITEGREKKSAVKALNQTFNDKQKASITHACSDMWEGYISAIKQELPDSILCFDRFHLVKMLNEAVDQVRRQEVKHQKDLRKTRYIWLKNYGNLTDRQVEKFNQINEANYKTAQAWHIKENFKDFAGESSTSKEIFAWMIKWCQDAMRSGLQPVVNVAERFQKNLKEIINGIIYKVNNAIAERLNGKLQEIKISARGYRKFENFRKAILFFHGSLSLFP